MPAGGARNGRVEGGSLLMESVKPHVVIEGQGNGKSQGGAMGMTNASLSNHCAHRENCFAPQDEISRFVRNDGAKVTLAVGKTIYFNSINTSTSGQRLATGWMEGRAITLQNNLLSVEMDSR